MRFRLAASVALTALLAAAGCTAVGSDGASESPVGVAEMSDASTSQRSERTDDESAAAAAEAVRTAEPQQLNGGEPGVPEQSGASVDDVLRLGAVAVWIEEPSVFAVSLPVSAECWPSAGEPVAVDGGVVVPFVSDATCAVPTAARTYTLQVPEGVDASGGLELSVVGLEQDLTLTLPTS
ncbi:hypothetical protein [Agrococcus sp. HG114]|uniref:hypothetical protein n=1 Tax=Agrococcus sp. HG114 TaxID=2969757 RepID=UPI00215A38F4|nr:hypothetical protein [Agrococcus sp. HG114]MCR8671250.1 hypothetical protein [Agrococcus sp. HG114]